jgi:hypothetical protein
MSRPVINIGVSASEVRPLTGEIKAAIRLSCFRTNLSYREGLARYRANEKHCWRCPGWHPISLFYRHAARWDGLAPLCIPCHKATASTKPRAKVVRIVVDNAPPVRLVCAG